VSAGDVDAAKSSVSGDGVERASADTASSFVVETHDSYGNAVDSDKSGVVVSIETKDGAAIKPVVKSLDSNRTGNDVLGSCSVFFMYMFDGTI
jgi:hypothetical protein